MNKGMYQYMADFRLPEILDEEFISLIPRQRALVNRMLSDGRISQYALSLESSKLWVVFNADSEFDALEMMAELPLTRFMQVEISILTFFNSQSMMLPAFSLN